MSIFDPSPYDILVLAPFAVFVLMAVLLWDSLGRALREQRVKNDVLRAEVEALRAQSDHFRDAWAKVQVRLDCSVDAADALRDERAAVVAWLREAANAPHPSELGAPMLTPAGRGLLLLHADLIERGKHRKEEQ